MILEPFDIVSIRFESTGLSKLPCRTSWIRIDQHDTAAVVSCGCQEVASDDEAVLENLQQIAELLQQRLRDQPTLDAVAVLRQAAHDCGLIPHHMFMTIADREDYSVFTFCPDWHTQLAHELRFLQLQ